MFKRGMSLIIITVLIILLALGSVTIIYTAVKPLLTDAGDKTTSGGACLAFDVVPAQCTINGTEARVRVERRAGQGTFAGITFSFDTPEGPKLVKLNERVEALESRTFAFRGTDVGRAIQVDVGLFLAGGTTCLLTGSPIRCADEGFQADAPACSDEIDNEPVKDGWIDQFDPGCLDSQGMYEPLGINETNNPLFQCSDGVDNDGEGDGFDGNDPDCDDYLDDDETRGMSLPLCGDNEDNDGDSWIDMDDPDCQDGGIREEWYALTECQDGMDNDRDGGADNNDAQCENANDRNERDVSDGAQCMNGRDDDGDGLIDYGIDPGCSGAGDNSEGSEETSHSFSFKFTNDGFLSSLNWTDAQDVERRVVWDEFGRYGPAWVRYYPHSAQGSDNRAWSVRKQDGTVVNLNHNQITYVKSEETSDKVTISSYDDQGFLDIKDVYLFREDTMFMVTKISNLRNEKLNIRLPMYLGALRMGALDEGGELDIDDTNITRLRPSRAGYLEFDFNTTNAVPNFYPSIESYSPVSVLWDDNVTIGEQYLTIMNLPTQAEFTEKARSQFNPSMMSFVNDELLPHESKTFTVAFKLAKSGDWQSALQPYRQWFEYAYGGTTPNYCPLGPMAYYVVWNSRLFNQENTPWYNPNFDVNRFYPDSNISYIFKVEKSGPLLKKLGIDLMGVWGAGPSVEYFTLEGKDWSEAQWTNNELFDPNLDIGFKPTELTEFDQSYASENVNVFWYIRPCAEVYGANITYDSDGRYTFVKGVPSRYRDVDLRNVTNRDRSIQRLRFFADKGVQNFYFDAMGCSGDEAYTAYVRKMLQQDYNVKPLLFKEGARDRDSLQIAQMPLIKQDFEMDGPIKYTKNSSLLIKELVPLGTYYAGIFNVYPLNETERDDILDKGYQVMEFHYPPYPRGDDGYPIYGNPPTMANCQRIASSYTNRYERWVGYGRSIGCDEPAQTPPPVCPV